MGRCLVGIALSRAVAGKYMNLGRVDAKCVAAGLSPHVRRIAARSVVARHAHAGVREHPSSTSDNDVATPQFASRAGNDGRLGVVYVDASISRGVCTSDTSTKLSSISRYQAMSLEKGTIRQPSPWLG